MIQPLNDLFEEEGWLDVMPAQLIERISHEGNIYSVPVNIHRANVMWYIPARLAEWGVQPPTTLAEFLTVAETLDMYTSGASYSTFEENFKGTLAPGMAADLIVVDRNPFTCDPSELKDVKVLLTVVGGVVGYEA